MTSVTSTELLVGLRDEANDPVWREFSSRYRPLIVAFARRLGLSDADAQDAAQDTLLAFAKSYRDGKYNRDRGRLRSWLFGIAQRKVCDVRRRRQRELGTVEPNHKTALIQQVVDENTMSDIWEAQWRSAILKQCLTEIREEVEPATIRAFELVSLKEKPSDEVASMLGMTRNAVMKANRRVLSRLRAMREQLEESW